VAKSGYNNSETTEQTVTKLGKIDYVGNIILRVKVYSDGKVGSPGKEVEYYPRVVFICLPRSAMLARYVR